MTRLYCDNRYQIPDLWERNQGLKYKYVHIKTLNIDIVQTPHPRVMPKLDLQLPSQTLDTCSLRFPPIPLRRPIEGFDDFISPEEREVLKEAKSILVSLPHLRGYHVILSPNRFYPGIHDLLLMSDLLW